MLWLPLSARRPGRDGAWPVYQ